MDSEKCLLQTHRLSRFISTGNPSTKIKQEAAPCCPAWASARHHLRNEGSAGSLQLRAILTNTVSRHPWWVTALSLKAASSCQPVRTYWLFPPSPSCYTTLSLDWGKQKALVPDRKVQVLTNGEAVALCFSTTPCSPTSRAFRQPAGWCSWLLAMSAPNLFVQFSAMSPRWIMQASGPTCSGVFALPQPPQSENQGGNPRGPRFPVLGQSGYAPEASQEQKRPTQVGVCDNLSTASLPAITGGAGRRGETTRQWTEILAYTAARLIGSFK